MNNIEGLHAGYEVGDQHPPLIVGVLNISPESFYKGSVASNKENIISKVESMIEQGSDVLDVGALSTRPVNLYGGKEATIKEETRRINDYLPIILEIANSRGIPVAIDTQHAQIAEIAIQMGVKVVNDISGLKQDPNMARVIKKHKVDLVIMATNKEPGDCCGVNDTISGLKSSLEIVENAGISRSKIVIDPGFGGWAGKDQTCDIKLLEEFNKLRQLNLPIYIGVSRKSTIRTLGGGEIPEDRLVGSVILTQWLVEHGAHIVRTHDVKETRYGLSISNQLKKFNQIE